ncbi:CBS domain-containing protein [Nocardioides sp. HB32]|jgi:CBS-domain-containing membrane protein
MLVRDLMTPDPVTATAETGIKQALTRLADLGITSMPVVDDRGRLCGIVSEADLIREVVPRDPRAQERPVVVEPLYPPGTVGEVCTRSAASVRIDDDVASAVELMTALSAKSVPVLDDGGRLVGILSRSDVVQALARSDDVIAADIDDLLGSLGHTDWLVEVEDGVVTVGGPSGSPERSLAVVVARTVPGVVEVHVD